MQTKHSIQDYVNVVKQGIAKNFQSERPKKVIIVGQAWQGCLPPMSCSKLGMIR